MLLRHIALLRRAYSNFFRSYKHLAALRPKANLLRRLSTIHNFVHLENSCAIKIADLSAISFSH